jgi:hypothetical protein
VAYVQDNGLKGRVFANLAEENSHLLHWETTVADTRIHGTTREQVGRVFRDVERSMLQPLPAERFLLFHEGRRIVSRDGHVEVDKAYYSAPPEYLGRQLWVRWDSRVVRLLNDRLEQVAIHVKRDAGQFSTQQTHLHDAKIATVERGADWLLNKAKQIGHHTGAWSAAMLQSRGIRGIRVLQGLLSLTKKYSSKELENACEVAHSYAAYRLKNVRRLLKQQGAKQEEFAFTTEHPVIRPLNIYDAIVNASPCCEAPSVETSHGKELVLFQ